MNASDRIEWAITYAAKRSIENPSEIEPHRGEISYCLESSGLVKENNCHTVMFYHEPLIHKGACNAPVGQKDQFHIHVTGNTTTMLDFASSTVGKLRDCGNKAEGIVINRNCWQLHLTCLLYTSPSPRD